MIINLGVNTTPFLISLSPPKVSASLWTPNAAPEWQARTLKRKEGIGGGLSTRGAGWTKPLCGRFNPIIDHASIFAKALLIDDVWSIARVMECTLPLAVGVPQ
jgi:hypothetical protein